MTQSRNPTARTTGWWLWKETVVDHAGGTSVFGGNAEVSETGHSLCVTERGFLTDQTACFLKQADDEAPALPEGELAGRSKQVALTLTSGEVKEYRSSVFGSLQRLVAAPDLVKSRKPLCTRFDRTGHCVFLAREPARHFGVR